VFFYTGPTIAGELKRHFRRSRLGRAVAPWPAAGLTLRGERAATGLTTQLDRAPTVRELAVTMSRAL
jgi:DNA-directed RNA polymerase specialized sigma subunit